MIKLENYLEKPYIKFILWFLTGLSVILFGILNVKADTYNATQFTAQLYDNYGPNLSAVTTDFTNNRYQGIIPTMVANSSGAAWGISSPVGLIANHTYTMTIEITGTYGGSLVLSTFNRIGVGTTLQNAINSYQNNSYADEIYSKVLDNGITIQFAFTPSINSSYIVFPFATSYGGNNQYFYLSNVIIDDLGSEGVTQDDINNSLTNQTNAIQNSINNIENNIINNQNSNQEQTNELLGDCRVNNYISLSVGSISSSSGTWYEEYYIPSSEFSNIKKGQHYFGFTATSLSFTKPIMASLIIFYSDDTPYQEIDIPTPENKSYVISFDTYSDNISQILVRFLRPLDYSNDFYRSGTFTKIFIGDVKDPKDFTTNSKYCSSKIDSTNEKLDNLDDTLTNSDIDNNNVSSSFEDFNNFLDDNSTITRLVTLPITLYTAILNNVNGSCSPFNLGNLYGVNLSLPCVNIGNYLGPVLWGMIDIIISGFAVYYISKKLVKIFNNVSSMKEGDVIDD